MKKAPSPTTLSESLKKKQADILKMGTIDVTLDCDTRVFIDPLLLADADDSEFAKCASAAYKKHFETVIKLLSASKAEGDKAWTAARKMLSFPEVGATRLGYSSSTKGAGSGELITNATMQSAAEIIRIGVSDPDLFLVLAFLEENVGADRISDMTTNIIMKCLEQYTQKLSKKLGMVTKDFIVNGKKIVAPENPVLNGKPLLLVPSDVVRALPTAADWSSVSSAAQETQDIRASVNLQIGEIWRAKSKRERAQIRRAVLSSKASFEQMLNLLRAAVGGSYDFKSDISGELFPSDLKASIAKNSPLDLSRYRKNKLSPKEVNEIVEIIIARYQELVEKNGLWKDLWDENKTKNRNEKAAQRLFFVVAHGYCEANDLDLSPEADRGTGPVDFKMSQGAVCVVVEIKLSSNQNVVTGFDKQLETYEQSNRAVAGHYVVIDLGNLRDQTKKTLAAARERCLKENGRTSKIWYVDGSVQVSARDVLNKPSRTTKESNFNEGSSR